MAGNHYNSRDGSPSVLINLETIRLQLSSMVARLQSRISFDTIRPLPVFLGVNPTAGFCLAGGAFTPPIKKVDKSTLEKIKSRVNLNFAYFLSNYVLVAAMTALVVALMHPGMVLFVGILYGLWSLHGFMIRHELIIFGLHLHSVLSVQQRFYLLFVLTALVVVLKCLSPAIFFLAISSFLILTHAFLRDPKHIDSMDASAAHEDDEYDEEGGGHTSGDSSGSEVMVDRPSNGVGRGDVI